MSPHEWPLYPADLRSGTKVILLRWCNCNCQRMHYVCSCPAHVCLPARRVESGDETTLCMGNEHAEYLWITVCAYVSQSTNTLPVRYVAVKYLWLCILLAYRLRGMQLMNHEYILAVSSVIAVQMKSINPLWNPEICFKSRNPSRNPLWNPEIRFEIQKSTLKSRNPFWNPKSTLKSRNPFWNPKSTWNPVDFEISYAETRRGGPLGFFGVEKTHIEEDLLIAWQTHCTLWWPLSGLVPVSGWSIVNSFETVAPMCLSSDSPDITASD